MVAQSYRSKLRFAGWLAGAGAIAAGLITGRIVRAGAPGEHFWIVFPLLLLVCALAFAACLPWWRRMDDMHRTGHLSSLGTGVRPAAWRWR